MKKRNVNAIGLVLSVLTASAIAQPTTAPASEPPAELMQLKPLIDGTRECRAKIFTLDGNAIEAITPRFTMDMKPTLGGFWYEMKVREDRTPKRPIPLDSDWTFGFDPATKKFIATGFGNQGGRWNLIADGVENGKVAFSGAYTGLKSETIRDTFTAAGHVSERLIDGKWRMLDEVQCIKK